MARGYWLLLLPLWAACDIPEFHYPPASPIIMVFEASPLALRPGDTVLVRYQVEGAETLSLEGGPGGPVALTELQSGVLSLPADRDRTLLLVAVGPGGRTQAQTGFQVEALRPVQVLSFGAEPTESYPGGVVQLRWQTQNARRILIRDPERLTYYMGSSDQGSLAILVPDRDLELTLTAEGDEGPAVATCRVVVNRRLPLILAFEASPISVPAGESSRLAWEVASSDFTSIVEERSGGGDLTLATGNSGSLWISPEPGQHTFRLEAVNALGPVSDRLTITVRDSAAPRIISFLANPSTVGPGGDVELSWRVDRGSTNPSIELRDATGVLELSLPPVGRRYRQVHQDTDFVLALREGPQQQQTVRVDPGLPILLAASLMPTALATGELLTVEAWADSGVSLRLEDELGAVVASSTTSLLSANFPAVGTQSYRVIAESPAGMTVRRFPIFVGERPQILSLSGTDALVRTGRPTCFSWSTSGADRVDFEFGLPWSGPLPMVGTVCGAPRSTATSALLTASSPLDTTSAFLDSMVIDATIAFFDDEPNDSRALAQGPYLFTVLNAPGELTLDDRDLYVHASNSIMRPLGSTAPAGGCTSPIEIWVEEDRPEPTGRGVLIPSNGGCPSIDARITPALADLEPPLLYELRHPSGGGVAAPYFLLVGEELRQCGDGILDLAEDCDDGGRVDGDGCSSYCYQENDESEPNVGEPANPLGVGQTLRGYLATADLDRFSVLIPAGQEGPYQLTVVPLDPAGLDLSVRVQDETRRFDLGASQDPLTGGAALGPPNLYLGARSYWIEVASGPGAHWPRRGGYELRLQRL